MKSQPRGPFTELQDCRRRNSGSAAPGAGPSGAGPQSGRNPGGQILVGATILLMTLLVMVPTLVQLLREESRMAVKEQRNATAFNLAEAGVDRALWTLKSTTSTWKKAAQGIALPGYHFDATYDDIVGGVYRVRISSGPAAKQVTVLGEGKDRVTGQVRAIQAIFENKTVGGPLLAGGVVTYSGAIECHWGPVMSHNNVNISGAAATDYFPRKLSKQVVTGPGGQPRDLNGINPPNTDNVEWWSDYPVPDLPLLDFVTIRASAAATGTLNVRTNNGVDGTIGGVGQCTGGAHGRCLSGGNSPASHTTDASSHHFFDSQDHALSKSNYIWYWDPGINVVMSGNNSSGCHGQGIHGLVIVRGNLSVDARDCYSYTGTVPANAWKEYAKIRPTEVDDASVNQYPADNGFKTNRLTFNHGSETWTGGPPAAKTDVGIRGFMYAGADLTINNVFDVAGTLWVAGNVVNNAVGDRVLVYYDGGDPQVPVLNVVLTRERWDEIPPSSVPWL